MPYTEMEKLSTGELKYDIDKLAEDLKTVTTTTEAHEFLLYISHAKKILAGREK